MQLKDKVVFVTGGARGIGSVCAKAVLERGAKVAVADIDQENGQKETKKFQGEFGDDKVIFIRCDVSKAEQFKQAFDEAKAVFGNIDVMINNAGIIEEVDWDKTIDVNLKGTIHGTELAIAHMRKDKGGRGGVIINIASVAGYSMIFFAPTYVASKHAVIGYTGSLASAPDVALQGIRYGCLCPNFVNTDIIDTVRRRCRQEYAEHAQALLPTTMLTPSKVGEALLTLLDDDTSNNTILEINLTEGLVRRKFTIEKA